MKVIICFKFLFLSETARSFVLLSSSLLSPRKDKHGDGDDWELIEDWILQDRVPDFTVHSTQRKRVRSTFWTQLKHSIPDLATRTELELQQRYHVLAASTIATSDMDQQQSTLSAPFIKCGPSPELLANWWMKVEEDDNNAPTVMMHGMLWNGSRISFPLQSAGTVGANDSPKKNDEDIDRLGFLWLLENSDDENDTARTKYAESSGGCIYELGTLKPTTIELKESKTQMPGFRVVQEVQERLASSTTSMGVTLSAVLAASLLSSYLAFNVGQSSVPPKASQPLVATTRITSNARPIKQQSQDVTRVILGSGMKYERRLENGVTQVLELTIGEQRASQELLVFREERAVINLREKLNKDEAKFVELKNKEDKQDPEELIALPIDVTELSVREQRARQELKIGKDKRILVGAEERLTRDRTKLRELQNEEAQQ